jgi:hypothetical protein
MLSTAPNCLGAIKGTPRRMEEDTEHTLSILDHSHFVFAHSFDILSDLSSVLVRTLRYSFERKRNIMVFKWIFGSLERG